MSPRMLSSLNWFTMATTAQVTIKTVDDATATNCAATPVTSQASSPTVATIAIKLVRAPYWPSDSQAWFAQVEAQFGTCRISSHFDYIISFLSPKFATKVRNLLIWPPADSPYAALCTGLIKRTTRHLGTMQAPAAHQWWSARWQNVNPTPLPHATATGRPLQYRNAFPKELFLQCLPQISGWSSPLPTPPPTSRNWPKWRRRSWKSLLRLSQLSPVHLNQRWRSALASGSGMPHHLATTNVITPNQRIVAPPSKTLTIWMHLPPGFFWYHCNLEKLWGQGDSGPPHSCLFFHKGCTH